MSRWALPGLDHGQRRLQVQSTLGLSGKSLAGKKSFQRREIR
jgi:hypothetical protein